MSALGAALAKSLRDRFRDASETALDPLVWLARRICRFGALLGGILFILSAALVTVEVFLRKVFNVSTGGAEELPAYGLAIASAWTYGFALIERGHIRVDSLYALWGPKVRAILDIAGLTLFLVFFGLVCYYGYAVLADSVRIGAHSRTGLYIPLAIPQSAWLVGLVLTVLAAVLLLLRAAAYILVGQLAAAQQIIGSKSLDEEIESEMEAIGTRRDKTSQGGA